MVRVADGSMAIDPIRRGGAEEGGAGAEGAKVYFSGIHVLKGILLYIYIYVSFLFVGNRSLSFVFLGREEANETHGDAHIASYRPVTRSSCPTFEMDEASIFPSILVC